MEDKADAKHILVTNYYYKHDGLNCILYKQEVGVLFISVSLSMSPISLKWTHWDYNV